MTEQELYLKYHRESGFQVGDKVKIIRTPKSKELGWACVICTEGIFEKRLGVIATIEKDDGATGFRIRFESGWDYHPYFVLELVERPKPVFKKSVALNSSHTAEVTKERIKVGCQSFTHEKMDELHALSLEARK